MTHVKVVRFFMIVANKWDSLRRGGTVDNSEIKQGLRNSRASTGEVVAPDDAVGRDTRTRLELVVVAYLG